MSKNDERSQLQSGISAFENGDYRNAYDLLLPLAQAANSCAQLYLGRICEILSYETGDFSEAISWYQMAAENENHEAAYELALLYLSEENPSPKRRNQANNLLKSSAAFFARKAKHGDPKYQFLYATMLWDGHGVQRSKRSALEWWRKAASTGNRESQFTLGQTLWFSEDRQDYRDEAFQWIKRAAKAGHSEAAYFLGAQYATGEDLPKDLTNAVYWYRQAARHGNAEAKYNLGLMFCTGEGVRKNLVQGRKFLTEAAEEGDILAQNLLVDAYNNGLFGFPRDARQANLWREKVERRGSKSN